MAVIQVKNLTKFYGKVCALDNVSTIFEKGKIYGLLGRNGAGKTTLLNLMTNRLFPTSGDITIDNEKVVENDNAIGKVFYMSEKNLYLNTMSLKKIFKRTKELYVDFDMDYAILLCDKFGLNSNKKIKTLSTGYNTISKIIITLASNAEILMFDEPILGLDAFHRDLFYKELTTIYIEKQMTIILSTHIIEEISDLLERVIIIKDKRIVIDESVEELLKTVYSVSGSSENVEKYILGKNCINIDQMAAFKSATIIGNMTEEDLNLSAALNLEITKVELQKLFIYLTNVGGVK